MTTIKKPSLIQQVKGVVDEGVRSVSKEAKGLVDAAKATATTAVDEFKLKANKVKAGSFAEVGALAGKAVDMASDTVTATDLGTTAMDTAAKVIESGKVSKLMSAVKVDAKTLDRASGRLANVGAFSGGVVAAMNSNNSTLTGKVVEGALVAANTKLMVGALTVVEHGNAVMMVDMALNYGAEKGLGLVMSKEEAANATQKAGGFLSGHLATTAKVVSAWGEALIGGDDRALNKFAEEAKEGKYGVLYQGALSFGQVASDKLDLASQIEKAVKAWDKGVSFLHAR